LDPDAVMEVLFRLLLKVLFPNPAAFRLNTNSRVVGWPFERVTNPVDAFAKVTVPVGSKFRLPCSVAPPLKSPLAAPSWHSLTLPGNTSFVQSKLPPPVKDNCFTTTFSCAEAVKITCKLVTFAWLKP